MSNTSRVSSTGMLDERIRDGHCFAGGTRRRAETTKILSGLTSGVLLVTLVCLDASSASAQTSNTITGAEGEIVITPFFGASVQVEYPGTVIHVDPYSMGDYSNAQPADLILITDTPGDHLDPDMIRRLRKPWGARGASVYSFRREGRGGTVTTPPGPGRHRDGQRRQDDASGRPGRGGSDVRPDPG